jgi:hypothetical protein
MIQIVITPLEKVGPVTNLGLTKSVGKTSSVVELLVDPVVEKQKIF